MLTLFPSRGGGLSVFLSSLGGPITIAEVMLCYFRDKVIKGIYLQLALLGHLLLESRHHAGKKERNHVESPYVSALAENPTKVLADS